jgi:hypothetical protein
LEIQILKSALRTGGRLIGYYCQFTPSCGLGLKLGATKMNDKEIEAVARALLKADKVMPLDDWAYTMAKAAISALDKVRGDKRSNQNENT